LTPTAARERWDSLFMLCGLFALVLAGLAFAALFGHMAADGLARLTPDFFTAYPSRRPDEAGILSAWVGSALVMLVTVVCAVPLGVAAGLYLEEYAARNWVTELMEVNIANLAGVPSVIYGLLALGLFVHHFGFGQSILTAGLTLALLILPLVIIATREAIRAVPQNLRDAAYALGATHWQVCKDHVLPYSMPGILTGVIIGVARAIGETAPLVTIGALSFIAFLPPAPLEARPPFLSFDWLFSSFTVLPIQMYNWLSRPDARFQDNAAAAGLVLLLMALGMNAVAIWLRYRLRKNLKW